MYGKIPDGTIPCIRFLHRQNPFGITRGDVFVRQNQQDEQHSTFLSVAPDGRIVQPDPDETKEREMRLNLLTAPFLVKEKDEQCSICLEEIIQATALPCQHYFHVACIRIWLKTRDTCPLCQMKIA